MVEFFDARGDIIKVTNILYIRSHNQWLYAGFGFGLKLFRNVML